MGLFLAVTSNSTLSPARENKNSLIQKRVQDYPRLEEEGRGEREADRKARGGAAGGMNVSATQCWGVWSSSDL